MKEQGVRGNAMQVEIGKIYEGTVKNITKYGAFVDIHNEENEKVMGMVHISEISRSFVNEIRDFVTEGQVVRVKVIGINEQGKISLSMKQAEPEQKNNNRPESRSGQQRPRQHREKPNVWEPKKKPPVTELTFEDMLSRFKQVSVLLPFKRQKQNQKKVTATNRVHAKKEMRWQICHRIFLLPVWELQETACKFICH